MAHAGDHHDLLLPQHLHMCIGLGRQRAYCHITAAGIQRVSHGVGIGELGKLQQHFGLA
jgi:hypothetical protein